MGPVSHHRRRGDGDPPRLGPTLTSSPVPVSSSSSLSHPNSQNIDPRAGAEAEAEADSNPNENLSFSPPKSDHPVPDPKFSRPDRSRAGSAAVATPNRSSLTPAPARSGTAPFPSHGHSHSHSHGHGHNGIPHSDPRPVRNSASPSARPVVSAAGSPGSSTHHHHRRSITGSISRHQPPVFATPPRLSPGPVSATVRNPSPLRPRPQSYSQPLSQSQSYSRSGLLHPPEHSLSPAGPDSRSAVAGGSPPTRQSHARQLSGSLRPGQTRHGHSHSYSLGQVPGLAQPDRAEAASMSSPNEAGHRHRRDDHHHDHHHHDHHHGLHDRPEIAVSRPVNTPKHPPNLFAGLPEIVTGALIPLSFILVDNPTPLVSSPVPSLTTTILGISVLASASLMLHGITTILSLPTRSGRWDHSISILSSLSRPDAIELGTSIPLRALQTLAPIFAASQLGAMSVVLVLLTALSAGLGIAQNRTKRRSVIALVTAQTRSSPACMCVLAALYIILLIRVLSSAQIIRGLLAIGSLTWTLVQPLPLIGAGYQFFYSHPTSSSTEKESQSIGTASDSSRIKGPIADTYAPPIDPLVSLFAGVFLTFLSIFLSSLAPVELSFSRYFPLAILALASTLSFARPTRLRSPSRRGIAVGCVIISLVGFVRTSDHWAARFLQFMLAGAVFTASYYDSAGDRDELAKEDRESDQHSPLTAYLLANTAPGSIIRSILIQQDSRRIAYFGCLNMAFMLVQFCYGFLTGSLGLLTDSIHMLFDCAGLAVGLAAAVMAKWPPTVNFPYGYGKVETLSGFANGVFLILVSVEIVADAIDRLKEGYELRRLNELLVVSILGFVVNIVGLMAFGHAHHHGHDHGHGHSHSHSHSHSHAHDHDHGSHHNHGHSTAKESDPASTSLQSPFVGHSHSHSVSHFHAPPIIHEPAKPPSPHNHSHSHGHSHADNENMEGIFLHILADALGSVSVIVSTVLTKWTSWSGWDPLASCIISVLIFASAVPLVRRSGARLLLSLSDQVDWQVRQALGELGNLPGVVGYRYARFWLADSVSSGGDGTLDGSAGGACSGHSHSHSHAHSSTHDHDHSHDHQPSSTSTPRVHGVIHIITTPRYDVEDVRRRCIHFLTSSGLDVVVHVEHESDAANCWCSSTNTLVGPSSGTITGRCGSSVGGGSSIGGGGGIADDGFDFRNRGRGGGGSRLSVSSIASMAGSVSNLLSDHRRGSNATSTGSPLPKFV